MSSIGRRGYYEVDGVGNGGCLHLRVQGMNSQSFRFENINPVSAEKSEVLILEQNSSGDFVTFFIMKSLHSRSSRRLFLEGTDCK